MLRRFRSESCEPNELLASEETLLINQETIYASLVRLLQRGWISSEGAFS